jgi:hypothetical protein
MSRCPLSPLIQRDRQTYTNTHIHTHTHTHTHTHSASVITGVKLYTLSTVTSKSFDD